MSVNVTSLPQRPLGAGDHFTFGVSYRNIPAGSGLVLSLVPDRPTGSGGTLTKLPIPIEGAGFVKVPFDGTVVSAPADEPVARPVGPGRYRLWTEVVDSHESTWGMLQEHQPHTLLKVVSPSAVMVK